jgi:hypothetical protein
MASFRTDFRSDPFGRKSLLRVVLNFGFVRQKSFDRRRDGFVRRVSDRAPLASRRSFTSSHLSTVNDEKTRCPCYRRTVESECHVLKNALQSRACKFLPRFFWRNDRGMPPDLKCRSNQHNGRRSRLQTISLMTSERYRISAGAGETRSIRL